MRENEHRGMLGETQEELYKIAIGPWYRDPVQVFLAVAVVILVIALVGGMWWAVVSTLAEHLPN